MTQSTSFLNPLNSTSVTATHPDLEATRLYFAGSWNRVSLAAYSGATSGWSATVSDTMYNRVKLELATWNPGFMLIQFGTNDITAAGTYARYEIPSAIRGMVMHCLATGCIPLVQTPPRLSQAYAEGTYHFDQYLDEAWALVASMAAELGFSTVDTKTPLDALGAGGNYGLSGDNVHPSTAGSSTADFSGAGLQGGYNIRNLYCLQALKAAASAAGVSGL
jgi:lysophospholipase L1-like esterase